MFVGGAVPLPPLGDHELLVFWVQVGVLLLAARVGGYLARRLGQPQVIGELLAGVALGPSVAGQLWPSGWAWLFPADERQAGLLLGLAWFGVVLLLMSTGSEADFGALRRHGRAAASTATGSLLLPLGAGIALGALLPSGFIGPAASRPVFALFVGIALAVSSLPVAARILGDFGLLNRPVGQLVLAVATSNDVVGWVLLGLVVGVAEDGGVAWGGFALTISGLLLVVIVIPLLGPALLDRVGAEARRRDGGPAASISIAIIFTVLVGAMTHGLGLEVVIGAFMAGIAIGRSRLSSEPVFAQLEQLAAAVFVPLFFAVAGIRVDLGELRDTTVLVWAAVVCAVATAAKLIGSYAGGRLGGLDRPVAATVAAALNARGALEIVIATVGVSIGVLSPASYTAIVVMAILTTALTAPLMSRTIGGVPLRDATDR